MWARSRPDPAALVDQLVQAVAGQEVGLGLDPVGRADLGQLIEGHLAGDVLVAEIVAAAGRPAAGRGRCAASRDVGRRAIDAVVSA